MSLSGMEELKDAILSLPKADYTHLRQWFFDEMDWQRWDTQIEADADDGKLAFLTDEALKSKREGALTDL